MGCCVCKKPEKAANKDCEYICGDCVAMIATMDRDTLRAFIDKLYLKDRIEAAEFLERMSTGRIHSAKLSNVKLKVRVLGYKNLKPRTQ